MNITGVCQYETPCGWCTKWDKKCDKKIGGNKQSSEIDFTKLLDDEGDPMKAEAIQKWNEIYKKMRLARNDLLDLDTVLEQKGMKRYDQP